LQALLRPASNGGIRKMEIDHELAEEMQIEPKKAVMDRKKRK
jgi:hypothetical protein